ncbi:unnamed protein product [Gadus morhua 'NCC']|uniref:forkhead box protein J1-A n=1 Tax=Gadus chalcogrammus TaxID=1042646 RepID=UPI0024C4161E|nr:forkhead box protein J1-A [Gadus chalcogrammus]XP_056463847.1 forkhead box protein J1-A [Gadus chalcogrammus]
MSASCEDSVGLEAELLNAAAHAEELDNNNNNNSNNNNNNNIFQSNQDSLCLDDSLTSLQWLQEFSILGPHGPSPPPHQQSSLLGQEAPSSPLAADPACGGCMPLTPGKPTSAAYSRMPFPLPGIVAHGHCPDDVDYRTNPAVKPPYSYATLICMAMQASQRSKISLSCIYSWITDNYCYFRHADPTWQNSIRHNLSLNKCFIKVPRRKDEPGKGGFWRIDPQYAERLLSGAYKKRRMPPVQINPALQGRLRPAPLSVDARSQRLLQEFEEATGAEQRWDPQLAEGTMLGSWPVSRVVGRKRKPPPGCRAPGSQAKGPRRSSSPLLCVEEQKELGSLKGSFDWDALLDSALSGDLSLDGPLSPIPKEDQDLTVHGTQIFPAEAPGGRGADRHNPDLEEETFLATAFLQCPWVEEEVEQGPGDYLCTSTVNLEQLFDLGDPLVGPGETLSEALL